MSGADPAASDRRFYVAGRAILAAAALVTLPHLQAHPDAMLLDTCRRLAKLWRRRDRLFTDGETRHSDEAHARFLRPIDMAAAPLLKYVCACQSRTMDGHRARAATFLATDESGLLARANLRDFRTERLLAAVVVDLIGQSSRSPSAPTCLLPAASACSAHRSGGSKQSSQLKPITEQGFPALPRRYFLVRDLVVTIARARNTVDEAARDKTSPDAALVAACREFIEVDDRRGRVLELDRRRAADERRLIVLDERFASLQRVVIGSRPVTPEGHCARAAAFVAADGNDLIKSANMRDQHETRMLAALVFDLLDKP